MSSLLTTKLYRPPLRPDWVPRARLFAQLDAGLRSGHKLTLVSAPAGWGKTTLLSAWCARCTASVTWLTLDEGDNDSNIFWAYVLAALEQVCPDLGEAVVSPLGAPQPLPIPGFLTPLLNVLAARPAPLCLVLDDYHVIDKRAIHEGLAFLLAHQPLQLHLVIATRADPPLPLARLRARRQLTELRAEDLRFTLEEASALLAMSPGLTMRPEEVQALERRTEGWAVGLHLAALALRDVADPGDFIAAFTGSHYYVLEYLTEEVIQRQPAEVRRFLLQSAILECLSGPLCDAVLDIEGSAAMLARLHQENLFLIPLDEERRRYRYHRLFADLLRNLLRQTFSEDHIRALHLRAGAWHEAHGTLPDAIHHAMKAQDFDRAAALIEGAADAALAHGNVARLERWIAALPDEVRQSRIRLRLLQGWVFFLGGQLAHAEPLLREVRAELLAAPAVPDRDVLLGRTMTLLATTATLYQDIAKAADEGEAALSYLPDTDLLWRARATRALAAAYGLQGDTKVLVRLCQEAYPLAQAAGNLFLAADILAQLASTLIHQGRLREAEITYKQILTLVRDPATFPPAGLGYLGLADVAFEWNDLPAAADHVRHGIDLCHRGGIAHSQIPALCTLALVLQGQGDVDGALAAMQQVKDRLHAAPSTFMAAYQLVYQVRLQLLLGNVAEAARWATGALSMIVPETLPIVLYEAQQVALARVGLAQGRPETVLALCRETIASADPAGRLGRVIELRLLEALALDALGRHETACVVFETCLASTAPEGHMRLFVEAGASVIPLLQQAAAHGLYPDYVRNLLEALDAMAPGPAMQPLLDPLTVRETEVLRLICAGYANRQIAEQLVVTLNTVKKHTSNIYSKLDVTRRTQAVARARELGLCE
ncbi:MAG: AAA family ATPase [Anaerolineae bacterium]|nr:AAA family ATPase [Anaerolineae bacterium]